MHSSKVGVWIRIPTRFLPGALRCSKSRRLASALATNDASARRRQDMETATGTTPMLIVIVGFDETPHRFMLVKASATTCQ